MSDQGHRASRGHRFWFTQLGPLVGVAAVAALVLVGPAAQGARATLPASASRTAVAQVHEFRVEAGVRHGIQLVLFDDTESSVSARGVLVRMLGNVVVPTAARRGDRLILALVSDASTTHPSVVADEDFAHLIAMAGGNPVEEARLINDAKGAITNDLERVLKNRPSAPASDWFGAMVWSEQTFAEFPPSTPKRLTTLGDLVNTTPGCSLGLRDLSTVNVPQVIQSCTDGYLPDFRGVVVVQGGAGLGDLPADKVLGVRRLWLSYWAETHATLACYAATLVASCDGTGRR